MGPALDDMLDCLNSARQCSVVISKSVWEVINKHFIAEVSRYQSDLNSIYLSIDTYLYMLSSFFQSTDHSRYKPLHRCIEKKPTKRERFGNISTFARA